MKDITYCSHNDCSHLDCSRHQHYAPDGDISIADFDDGYCFIPVQSKKQTMREKLLIAICAGTQKTNYSCDALCKAMCGSDGTCAYCSIIADAIEEALK